MKFVLFLSILISFISIANDGAFFANGNQLIPISDSTLEIKKEVLTINRINADEVEVIVDYTFFNPGETKTILMGFEAESPSGDVNCIPRNGRHPYMRDFTVAINNLPIDYKVSLVDHKSYKYQELLEKYDFTKFDDSREHSNYCDFNYVYHFNAIFLSGLNKVYHTYTFKLSAGIAYAYHFDYLLSPAKRWANHQIDDFTLTINLGPFSEYKIAKTFFEKASEWDLIGIGKIYDSSPFYREFYDEPNGATKTIQVYVQEGYLSFRKENFQLKGELILNNTAVWTRANSNELIGYGYYGYLNDLFPTTEKYYKLLRNLPYAYRGYIFKDKDIQKEVSKQEWYLPNENYIPVYSELSTLEKQWLKALKERYEEKK